MAKSLSRIWVHAIWSTKERKPLIAEHAEYDLHEMMKEEFKALDCSVSIINGMSDHVHALFILNHRKALADVMKNVKGNSSHYINQTDLLQEKFSWQKGFASYSVSESVLEKVYHYIRNQKEHHKVKSFESEYEEFKKICDEYNED